MPSGYGPQQGQHPQRPRRGAVDGRADHVADEQQERNSTSPTRRHLPEPDGHSRREEDPNREFSHPDRPRRSSRDASDPGANEPRQLAEQLDRIAQDGDELHSRSSLRRSRHPALGPAPAQYKAPPPSSPFGNFSFDKRDARFDTDGLLDALEDGEPHERASERRRDGRSRSPRTRDEYNPRERDGPEESCSSRCLRPLLARTDLPALKLGPSAPLERLDDASAACASVSLGSTAPSRGTAATAPGQAELGQLPRRAPLRRQNAPRAA
ncbi:uncharacterized protein RHOBADRAFT_21719 [Rhodotorula graminis WP1]|uniref:Uncharacterized protein n=1 Tax=Rhodotorula graminis (strain WP1) TaxID=578459 RepID=A0A194S830_RHOGW|nr:uncharacterized protein RHOBADRAFT_21719 [Rhodotorula graminis WP1]KPV76640.1 hypothetical protein RHOBADRAFT_21719 [Rhodotorula graminis WP1]